MLLIMTNRGLNAVMDSQVRLGANVSVAVASVGAGVQGSTTAAVGADIVAFAEARGLFGGVSLEGGVMSARIDENQAYYGQPFAARQIVLQMQGVNPGADPLREVLTRYGGGGAGALPGRRVRAYQPPGQPGIRRLSSRPAVGYPAAAGPAGLSAGAINRLRPLRASRRAAGLSTAAATVSRHPPSAGRRRLCAASGARPAISRRLASTPIRRPPAPDRSRSRSCRRLAR